MTDTTAAAWDVELLGSATLTQDQIERLGAEVVTYAGGNLTYLIDPNRVIVRRSYPAAMRSLVAAGQLLVSMDELLRLEGVELVNPCISVRRGLTDAEAEQWLVDNLGATGDAALTEWTEFEGRGGG